MSVCRACRGHCPEGTCLSSPGVDDPHQHGRGVALADFNRDGKVDIVYGNWNGPHRLYLQMSAHGKVRFRVRRALSLLLPPSSVSGPGISWGCSLPPTREGLRRGLQLCRAWRQDSHNKGNIWGKMVDSSLGFHL